MGCIFRKTTALLLALCMIAGMTGLPITAYAEGLDNGDGDAAIVATDTKEFPVTVLKEGEQGLLFGLMSVTWVGDGLSEATAFQVSSAEHLADIPNQGLDKHYIQTMDITLPEPAAGESNWTPIGSYDNPFDGTYDGGGFSISDLTTTTGGGLFNFIMNGTVKNLRIENADVTGGSNVGILANIIAGKEGAPERGGKIINCSTSGRVTGLNRIGGLVGGIQLNGSFIRWSSSAAEVTSTSYESGGLVGFMLFDVAVRDSYATGTVNGPMTGGLIGRMDNGRVERSYAAGRVSGSITQGGLIVVKNGGTVLDSFYDTSATEQDSSAGGTGKSKEEMQQQATYSNWNFSNIWSIDEGSAYPVLRDLNGSYTVSYVGNGGAGSVPEDVVKAGISYTLPGPDAFTPPTNFAFGEWNTAANGTGIGYESESTITMPAEDMDLYAIWKRIPIDWEGEGTIEEPWKVSSSAHLDAIRDNPSAHYIQTEDIDLAGFSSWVPIGTADARFSGTYNGNGKTISSLKISEGPRYSGLFAYVDNSGILTNIRLENAQISSSGTEYHAGSLVGQNFGNVTACNTINPSVSINGTYATGGGLVGYNAGSVSNSYSTVGSVTGSGDSRVGGLVGRNGNTKTVRYCYSTTSVNGPVRGGLIGWQEGSVTNSYYDQNTSGQSDSNKGVPKTTTEMKQLETFTDWDFADVWKLHEDNSYPKLQWESAWTMDEEINAARHALNWGLIGGGNSAPDNVTNNLSILPEEGAKGTAVSWSVTPEQTWLTDSGAVTRPSLGAGNQTVSLTATVSKPGGTTLNKIFNLTIKAGTPDDDDISEAVTALEWEDIRGANTDIDNVTTDLELPGAGENSTVITWSVFPEGYINTSDGTVTRPNSEDEDEEITLTATISKGTGTPQTKQFELTVKAYTIDEDIDRAVDALTWAVISNGNAQNGVTGNLVNPLPTSGTNGTSIIWSVGVEGWLNASDGTVTLPALYQGPQTVVLTATVSKGGGTPQAKSFTIIVIPAAVDWGGGDGSEEFPYLVSSADHLFSVRFYLGQDVYFKQTTDIDMEGTDYSNWPPIGTSDSPFAGTYDGDGKTISNLVVNNPDGNHQGLFGFILGGTVQNLHVENADITGKQNVGILAGIIADKETYSSGGKIINCSTGGTVTGIDRVGGIIGSLQHDGGFISGSFSTAEVTATGTGGLDGYAGGLSGSVYFAVQIRDSYASGPVGGLRAGGLIGYLHSGEALRCYAAGEVTGSPLAGGLVAVKDGGTVTDSYYDTGATGQTASAGGTGKTTAEMKQQSTYANWGFTDVWKIGESVSLPSLFWQDWTVAEEITAAKYTLTWEDIRGSNGAMNSVISNLSLPSSGEKDTIITWSVPSEQTWLTADGTVTRPLYTEEDETVALTAIFSKSGGAGQSRDFTLTIKKADTPTNEETVTLDHAALTWDIIKNSNTSENQITGNLNLTVTGTYGSEIAWSADPTGHINTATGAVTRPLYNQPDAVITLTAVVSKTGAEPLSRTFNLTVKAAAATETQATEETLAWLTWDIIKGDNDYANNVKTNLNLTTTGLYGATITWWNVSGSSTIYVSTGVVDRPSTAWGDQNVTIKADIQKGATKLEKEFYLTVKAVDLTDLQCVLADNASLTWNTIKGANSEENNITLNLASLPTTGANGTTITWAAMPAGQSWLSIPSGALTRPTMAEGNQTITLTATISKGSEQITHSPFTLVLKASSFARGNGTAQHPYEISNATELANVRNFLGIDNSNVYFLQTADIALSGNWTPIGDASVPFFGKYNGGGYRISGLRVDGSYNDAGLFGYTWNPAVLENIRLTGVYIRSNTNNIQSLGALCGYNRGTVKNCSAEGEVLAVYGTVQARAGVLIGYNAGTVERCFSAGSVSISGYSSTHAGGLVGRNEGTIRECYSRASAYAGGVNGSSGGLVGNNSSGVIERSYSTGGVSGDGADHTEGGLVGYQSGGSTSDSFYNSQTSGKGDAGKGTPKTTVEMKQQMTFPTWDFTADTGAWWMMETFTYPLLQWQTLTADEIIVLDTAALSWETIKGANSAENNVMTDLSLPASGENGASITWEASPTGYIDSSDGKVTRPHDEDKIVILTARVNRSGGTEQTKAFTLTIKLDPIPPTTDGSNNSGGSSGGSSSGDSGVTVLPEKKPDQPVKVGVTVISMTGNNGLASVTVSDQTVKDAIAKAQEEAKKQGNTANGIGVALNVNMPQGSSSLSLTLSQTALQSLTGANAQSLEIGGGIASLGLNLEALKEIQKQSSGDVTITIKPVQNLSEAARKLIGTRPVYDVTISCVKDGKTVNITSLGTESATLSFPYTPGKNEAVGWLFGVYVDGKGNVTRIPGSAYDANSGSILLDTGHLSVYGVGYTSPSEKYTDIANHWAKESIDYAVGRGLFSGTTEKTFSPNTVMDRGMLVTVLGRLAGADVSGYKTSSFSDVAAGKYYLPYVEWAYKKGIISGIGNGRFAPERAVTREEIALILQNYPKATGYTLPVIREAITFADNSSIGSSYASAARAMQQAGIMMGGSGNKFNPKTGATRAEVATMLRLYVKLTIDPSTAQGWVLNDDGRYMYYKDGKLLIGWQTIDGVKYYFYSTGVLQTGWVKDGNNWRFYSGNKALVGWWNIGSETNKKCYYFDVNAVMVSGK